MLELGAGIGLCSLVLASVCHDDGASPPPTAITITDKRELLPIIQHNVASCSKNNTNFNSRRIVIAPLVWGTADVQSFQCDVVIGADLTYDLEALPPLIDTVRTLCNGDGGTGAKKRFVLAFSKERYATTVFLPLLAEHFDVEHVEGCVLSVIVCLVAHSFASAEAVIERLEVQAKLASGDVVPDFEFHRKGILIATLKQ